MQRIANGRPPRPPRCTRQAWLLAALHSCSSTQPRASALFGAHHSPAAAKGVPARALAPSAMGRLQRQLLELLSSGGAGRPQAAPGAAAAGASSPCLPLAAGRAAPSCRRGRRSSTPTRLPLQPPAARRRSTPQIPAPLPRRRWPAPRARLPASAPGCRLRASARFSCPCSRSRRLRSRRRAQRRLPAGACG